jgi:hypothetical protein
MPDHDPQLAFSIDRDPTPTRPPAFALLHLPDGWPATGTIEKLLLVMVRDDVPDRGLVVDALDAHWHQVAGSMGEMREALEKCKPRGRKA